MRWSLQVRIAFLLYFMMKRCLLIQDRIGCWISYSLRTCPFTFRSTVLGQHCSGFDCASVAEINLALNSNGNDGRRCVYANPQRAEGDLATALSLGVEALTFDGAEELKKIKMAHETRLRVWKGVADPTSEQKVKSIGSNSVPMPPEVILRILVPDTKSSVPLGEKFGAKPSDVAALTESALDLELPLVGVSFHCGSGCHDPNAYGIAIRLAKGAIDTINRIKEMRRERDGIDSCIYQKCSLLDIGGGYPGLDGGGGDVARFCGIESAASSQTNSGIPNVSDGEETAAKIAAVVSPLVDSLFPRGKSEVSVISEPGRYFVESAFALCSRIYCGQTDAQGRRHYYIAQGVHGVFKDALLCGEDFSPVPLTWGSRKNKDHCSVDTPDDRDGPLFCSTVHGPSGDDFDVRVRRLSSASSRGR